MSEAPVIPIPRSWVVAAAVALVCWGGAAAACEGGCAPPTPSGAAGATLVAPDGSMSDADTTAGDECPRDCHRCTRGCCAGPAVSVVATAPAAPAARGPGARHVIAPDPPVLPGPGARVPDQPPRA